MIAKNKWRESVIVSSITTLAINPLVFVLLTTILLIFKGEPSHSIKFFVFIYIFLLPLYNLYIFPIYLLTYKFIVERFSTTASNFLIVIAFSVIVPIPLLFLFLTNPAESSEGNFRFEILAFSSFISSFSVLIVKHFVRKNIRDKHSNMEISSADDYSYFPLFKMLPLKILDIWEIENHAHMPKKYYLETDQFFISLSPLKWKETDRVLPIISRIPSQAGRLSLKIPLEEHSLYKTAMDYISKIMTHENMVLIFLENNAKILIPISLSDKQNGEVKIVSPDESYPLRDISCGNEISGFVSSV